MVLFRTLFAGLFLLAATAAGQSLRVSFSATDRVTVVPVQLDSVRIENLSTMRDTVIKDPFIIDLGISTGIRDRLPGLVRSLEIGGNFANPFTDATNFTVTTGLRGRVQLELYSLAGRREAFMESQLEAGTHVFSLNAASLPAGVYLLTARSGESSRTVRIVKNGPAGAGTPFFFPGGSTGIVVQGAIGKPFAAAYRFTGYAGTFHPDTVTAAPVSDTSIVFMMRRLSIPPVIESFACLTPNLFPGDTARFGVTASSAIKSLSRIFIDFENDGVMDDSAVVAGGSAQVTFTHVYSAVGRYNVRACAADLYGNSCCRNLDSAVNVSLFLPVLTTVAVNDITATTGRSGGNITSDGGYPVTARGVCWSTSPGPTTADSHTTDCAGTGSFESSITSLAESTKYYVRAYAVNSAGTGYGNEVSFTTNGMSMYVPVLTTAAVTEITVKTGRSGGNITSDGGYPVTARGVCWSTSPGPTTADSHTTDGTGTGSFESSITGLSERTKYYVRAYAVNSAGTGYGNEVQFMTKEMGLYVPVLTTTAVTDITLTTAKSGGDITSDGGYPVTARGVCWSTSPNPTTSDSHTTDGAGTGSFESSIAGLAAGTKYYVRAYAVNSAGTGYGNEVWFTTDDAAKYLPVLTTSAATDITLTTARSGGSITSDGGYPVTARGVCWSTASGPTISDSRTSNGTGIGFYTSNIAGLSENTMYYLRAYATNSAGTGYGNEVSFTTQQGSGGSDTVTIGTQVWMLKNLDVDKYRNGDPIPNVTDSAQWAHLNETSGAWCYYNNDPATGAIYGKLYNWAAVNDPRGLAPAGWHVPTDSEWKTLTNYLGDTAVAGGKMKEAGTAHWLSPNTGADNSSGFTGLPGGFRSFYGPFRDFGNCGLWWSSTISGLIAARTLILLYNRAGAWAQNPHNRGNALSVRCVKD